MGATQDSFDLQPGRVLARKFEVIRRLGAGWEGEVYLVRERATGIDRAAKLFFPERNPRNRTLNEYARRLHRLRECPILVSYVTQETVRAHGADVSVLISEFVDGEMLCEFLARQPGHRLDVFQGLHLLHALAEGVSAIHANNDYHGDLHAANVIVRRLGLGFEVRLLDLHRWSGTRSSNIQEDVCNLVRLLYDVLGGARTYAKHPPEIKGVLRGLRRTLILESFRTAGDLALHLETMPWESR
ncbi:MAG: protein kinase [bacterium]|nr:protein kinase [bacterium]